MSSSPYFRIPVGDWADAAVDWVTTAWEAFFDGVSSLIQSCFDGVDWLLAAPPFWLVIIVLTALAWVARGWLGGLSAAAGFLVIYGMDQWENAMDTLSLVLVSSFFALVIGIPLGIWASRSQAVSRAVRPVLDFLQTMPAFVYLIPFVVIFRVGIVPAVVATIMFAIAPGVRFTELGIRQVDKEVVEAGQAFGATPTRILYQIQLPLARATIMGGVNQVIMLSLSMVVIAGMVGAGGLGSDVVTALQRVNVGLGVEAGLSVVLLAVYLDRVTAAFGSRSWGSR
ncbi:proline/glycine betaine ABC transporter permease [Actinomyces sp. 2119]|uniref:Proline/glycine betaine ABC transporter permease n=1 Tax=Actinomyces lilanjuaniae TaxID=2321394 RepID=A0ABN5PQ25_9ACTO|nr:MULTISPECIES: proline/glycine betaine ABC transporter permease [Actinomyces]AYD90374.1 proline/glycine betaine ABC transporter permease [Actinomyces lilanjuaniae]RJF40954.1 proline/glycine betaine ABC transporter permease [Actinomyces sp. 2119]